MTKEEALNIIRNVFFHEDNQLNNDGQIGAKDIHNALTIACAALCEPSLPSDLDDVKLVKEQVQEDWYDGEIADTTEMDHVDYESIAEHYFNLGKQAGAEWMAEKFVKVDGSPLDWFNNRFKSLRPQLRQEWSEEDEDMLNSCISSIEEAKENRYAYNETDGDTSYDQEISWLKSLRPQPKAEKSDYITPHKEFFKWIYDRLINVHKEDPNVDYMISFKQRIEELPLNEPQWKPSRKQIDALVMVLTDETITFIPFLLN